MRSRDADFARKKGDKHRKARPGNRNGAKGPRVGRQAPSKPLPTGTESLRRGLKAPLNRQRRTRAKTGGRDFAPGRNSHDGQVFRRGADNLPRGNITLMFRCILHDEREALYQSIVREIRRSGDFALTFLEKAGNRIEGLPVKKVETQRRGYGAVFVFSDQPPAGSGPPASPPPRQIGAGATPPGAVSALDQFILGGGTGQPPATGKV